MSASSYIRARRLAKAARAIAETDDSNLNIALGSGYASYEAFTRAFTSCFGVLPSSIRT